MIIFEDKNIHQNSLYPDTDWTGKAKWTIPDTNVKLCTKVMKYCPYFDVITDDENNVIDIIGTGPDISIVISNKLYELSNICEKNIIDGFDYQDKHYSLKINDQLNLEALRASITDSTVSIPYHADGELCMLYPVEEFLEIYKLATYHKMYHTTYFNQLKDMINKMTDKNEISSCYYGMPLDTIHNSNLHMLLNI